jgi:thioredoxin-like negative regulator of GroEL
LVNFWAEWAGPCHRLLLVLAELASEYGGRFLLVNVNTGEEKASAQE